MENNIRSLDGLFPRQRCEKEDRSAGPQSLWIGTLGHELGHDLELPHPPGCGEEGGNCDSDALMWLGTWNYPDTYLREDEKTKLRLSPFITVESVPDEIFLPEKLQDNGVYLPPAGEKSKFFPPFDPALSSFQPLSCQLPAFQNLVAETARGPWW